MIQYPFGTTMTAAKSRFTRRRYPTTLAVALIVAIVVAMAAPAKVKRPKIKINTKDIDIESKNKDKTPSKNDVSLLDKFKEIGEVADSINDIAGTAQLVGPLIVNSTPSNPNAVVKRHVEVCPKGYIMDPFGDCVPNFIMG